MIEYNAFAHPASTWCIGVTVFQQEGLLQAIQQRSLACLAIGCCLEAMSGIHFSTLLNVLFNLQLEGHFSQVCGGLSNQFTNLIEIYPSHYMAHVYEWYYFPWDGGASNNRTNCFMISLNIQVIGCKCICLNNITILSSFTFVKGVVTEQLLRAPSNSWYPYILNTHTIAYLT